MTMHENHCEHDVMIDGNAAWLALETTLKAHGLSPDDLTTMPPRDFLRMCAAHGLDGETIKAAVAYQRELLARQLADDVDVCTAVSALCVPLLRQHATWTIRDCLAYLRATRQIAVDTRRLS